MLALGVSVTNTLASDDSPTSLPIPLTLEIAIQEGTHSTHPVLKAARADQQAANAELESADSNYTLESSILLQAGYVEPNNQSLNNEHDDHLAQLNIRKRLYDFGVTEGKINAAENLIIASRLEYEHARQNHVVNIAKHYFDVLLADLKFMWDNEFLARQYIRYDRTLDQYDLKQVSDVELLQSESAYQLARTTRIATETVQRSSRALLAVVINRPGDLSAELKQPDITVDSWELPDLEELVSIAVKNNLEIKALRKRETAARLALNAARNLNRPTLDATLEISEYSRKTLNRDDARARLNLVIPLNESGSQRTEIAESHAKWLQASSAVMQLGIQLRSEVAEVWQQTLYLLTQREELKVTATSAEIDLDRARGEYELEIKTDLGDAMINTTRVRYEQARNSYELALSWMRLNILIGRNPEEIIQQGKT